MYRISQVGTAVSYINFMLLHCALLGLKFTGLIGYQSDISLHS